MSSPAQVSAVSSSPAATRPSSKLNRDNPRRNAMGTVKVTIAVGDPQGRQFEELDVTIDTGSTYTEVHHGKNPK